VVDIPYAAAEFERWLHAHRYLVYIVAREYHGPQIGSARSAGINRAGNTLLYFPPFVIVASRLKQFKPISLEFQHEFALAHHCL
jgi:hypothetical protein